jgi:1,2-dihydroxy-3-keto-5-methylthiopentene dioxygenase
MTTVTFFDRVHRAPLESLGADETPAALRALDVLTGRWALRTQPVSNLPQLTYARELHALQRRFATVLTDRVHTRPAVWRGGGNGLRGSAAPDVPDEHIHRDDEVRVLLQGRARFVVRAPVVGGWAVIDCSPGDWVALPAGLPHAFESDPAQGVDMLRLFARRRGWMAERSGGALPRELLRWAPSCAHPHPHPHLHPHPHPRLPTSALALAA